MESGHQLNHGFHSIETQVILTSDTMCRLATRERPQHDHWRTADELSNADALFKEYEESSSGQQQPSAAPITTPPAALVAPPAAPIHQLPSLQPRLRLVGLHLRPLDAGAVPESMPTEYYLRRPVTKWHMKYGRRCMARRGCRHLVSY